MAQTPEGVLRTHENHLRRMAYTSGANLAALAVTEVLLT